MMAAYRLKMEFAEIYSITDKVMPATIVEYV